MEIDPNKLFKGRINPEACLDYANNTKHTDSTATILNILQLRFIKDKHTEELKRVNGALAFLEKSVLPRLFEEEGTKTRIMDELEVRVSINERLSVSIVPSMKVEAREWLKENGLSEIIQPTVNANTLTSSIKMMIEEKGISPPEEYFKINEYKLTSITKT